MTNSTLAHWQKIPKANKVTTWYQLMRFSWDIVCMEIRGTTSLGTTSPNFHAHNNVSWADTMWPLCWLFWCLISAFNAQGSRGIIVAVLVGAVKIYVAAMEALRKKQKDRVKLRNHQNWWFSEFHSMLNVNVNFCRFFG